MASPPHSINTEQDLNPAEQPACHLKALPQLFISIHVIVGEAKVREQLQYCSNVLEHPHVSTFY